MPEKELDKMTARTTILTTETDRRDYIKYCQSIEVKVSERLREFMRADMEEWRAGK